LYGTIIKAGTHKAASIKVAEAAKVIENIQRDVNIALVNELSMIFNKMNIDTEDVLNAAETKWNFIKFRPGLVGGHCIGVDPYYLTYKSKLIGHEPKIINAGREINEAMPTYVCDKLIDLMQKRDIEVVNSKVLILGYSFKENCPDSRNTKVHDMVQYLKILQCDVEVFDSWIDETSKIKIHDINFISAPKEEYYDALIIAVGHNEFLAYDPDQIRHFCNPCVSNIVFDLKHVLPKEKSDLRL
jgi:UDP-N-acetyl-D-galactosamine dehydrogenase